MLRLAAALVALLALLLTAACSDSSPSGRPSAVPSSPASPSPTAARVAGLRFDRDVRLTAEWSARSCGGDAPVRCVYRGPLLVGLLEYTSFPVSSLTYPATPERIADESLRADEQDRGQTCRGLRFAREEFVGLPVAGSPAGGRYGFTLVRPGGAVDERTLSYVLVDRTTVHIVVVSAYGDRSCLAAEGRQFTPPVLAAFLPVLDQAIAGMTLPQ